MITNCENTQEILSVLPHNNARIQFMQEGSYEKKN